MLMLHAGRLFFKKLFFCIVKLTKFLQNPQMQISNGFYRRNSYELSHESKVDKYNGESKDSKLAAK